MTKPRAKHNPEFQAKGGIGRRSRTGNHGRLGATGVVYPTWTLAAKLTLQRISEGSSWSGLVLILSSQACWNFELPVVERSRGLAGGSVDAAAVDAAAVDAAAVDAAAVDAAAVDAAEPSPATLPCVTEAPTFTALRAPRPTQPTRVNAVSGDGRVAVGALLGDQRAAVRWEEAQYEAEALPLRLEGADLSQSEALATNRTGQFTVGWGQLPGGGSLALLWDGRPLRIARGRGTAISADGSVVVGIVADTEKEQDGFLWSLASNLVRLPRMSSSGIEGSYLKAHAVNADGTVVVGEGDSQGGLRRAFRWTLASRTTGIGELLDGKASFASTTSADGRKVAGAIAAEGGWQPFLWTAEEATMVPLGSVQSSEEVATPRMSGDGLTLAGVDEAEVVVWRGSDGSRTSLVERLDGAVPSGWQLETVRGISNDGQVVVGNGTSPKGLAMGWLAKLGAHCEPKEKHSDE